MPPSRTVAPYSQPGRPLASRRPLGHERHPRPFIPVTNAIEALNRQLRKAIKTKGHFPNDDAARNLIYLAVANAGPAWTRTRNWTAALLEFKIHFGDRLAD
jgi:putative transposase